MFTIDDLADRLGGYLPPDEIQQVKRAFYYAEQAHDGQRPLRVDPHQPHVLRAKRLGGEGVQGGEAAVPTPGNFYVNLPPLFLGHFSPIFARFSPVFSPFSPSCPQDSGNRHQDPEKRSETVEKRRAKTPKLTLIFLGVGTRG